MRSEKNKESFGCCNKIRDFSQRDRKMVLTSERKEESSVKFWCKLSKKEWSSPIQDYTHRLCPRMHVCIRVCLYV